MKRILLSALFSALLVLTACASIEREPEPGTIDLQYLSGKWVWYKLNSVYMDAHGHLVDTVIQRKVNPNKGSEYESYILINDNGTASSVSLSASRDYTYTVSDDRLYVESHNPPLVDVNEEYQIYYLTKNKIKIRDVGSAHLYGSANLTYWCKKVKQ